MILYVNDKPVNVNEEQAKGNLLRLLREDLGLTGAKDGCGKGLCGACTVLVDGKAVRACVTKVDKVLRKHVVTIEGLARNGELHPLQQAFLEHGAVQCGYCSPGMIMSGLSLLLRNPAPTKEEVKAGIRGNICRCTGYEPIVEAIMAAGRMMKNRKNQG